MIDVIMIANALVYAISIALGSVGITIIYSATKTFNFVHSSMVGWGCYTVFALTYILGGIPHQYFPMAFLVSGAIGVITYISVNRRLIMAKASDINLMMSTLGVDLIMFAFLNIFADYLLYVRKIGVAKSFILRTRDPAVEVLGINVRFTWVTAPIIMFVILLAVYILFNKTRLGIAIKATTENPELIQLQGINPEHIYLTSWFIGGGLAGLAGGLMAMIFRGTPAIGMETVVTFFAGAIVGGLDIIHGGFIGGALVGLSEYIVSAILSRAVGDWIIAYRSVISLAIMVTTLFIKPSGIGVLVIRRR